MNQMIDDLKEIPGVIGAYTWHTEAGPQDNNLPALFKAERLNAMAQILTKIHAAGRHNFADLGDTLICFEEASTLCRQLGPDNFLVMVCDASINMNLLTISLNLAVESYFANTGAAQQAGPAGRQAPSPEQLKSMQSSGPLAKPLQIMSSELFSVMGPMASIVFEENLLDWATSDPPSVSRLTDLLESLCTETSDPDKARHYRQLVRNRLGDKNA